MTNSCVAAILRAENHFQLTDEETFVLLGRAPPIKNRQGFLEWLREQGMFQTMDDAELTKILFCRRVCADEGVLNIEGNNSYSYVRSFDDKIRAPFQWPPPEANRPIIT